MSEAPIPSAVLGVHAPLAHLATAGLCEWRAASSIDLAAGDLAWADAVVLVRGAAPAERRILDEARRLGRKVATYLDDDLEQVPATARSAYFFRSPVVRGHLAAITRGADLVLACRALLADELAARHGREVRLFLQPRPDPPALATSEGAPRDAGTLRVGFLGSVDHGEFLTTLLERPLTRLRGELGRSLELVFCGATPGFARTLGAECRAFEPDLPSWRAQAARLRLDVGLAPIPDSPFHRRKYFNKYLEYGSLGVAAIYSSGSPNADVVRDGETGLVRVNHPDAWYEALRRLSDSPGDRARIAAAAAADVEARFSPRALEAGWQRALAPLLAHRAPPISSSDVRLPSGQLRWALDRRAIYGTPRFLERVLRRLSGRLPPG